MILEEMRQAHIAHGHHEQAARIADTLKSRFPALDISRPEGAESGKFIAVYVTLVRNTMRMALLLTYPQDDHHVYQLRGVNEQKPEAARFEEFISRQHQGIEIHRRGSNFAYARVPAWENQFISNSDHDAIAWNVLVALAFVANLPTPRWDA